MALHDINSLPPNKSADKKNDGSSIVGQEAPTFVALPADPPSSPNHRTNDRSRRVATSVLENDTAQTARARRNTGRLDRDHRETHDPQEAAANENRRLQVLLLKEAEGKLTDAEKTELEHMEKLTQEANKRSTLAVVSNAVKQVIFYLIPAMMKAIMANSKEGMSEDLATTLKKVGVPPSAASVQDVGHKADPSKSTIAIAGTNYQIEIDSRYLGKDNPFTAANRAKLSPDIVARAAAAPKPTFL